VRKDVDELYEVRRPQLLEQLYLSQRCHVHTLSNSIRHYQTTSICGTSDDTPKATWPCMQEEVIRQATSLTSPRRIFLMATT